MLLLRLISFHVLIYASIVFLLGVLTVSTLTDPALQVGDAFLFRSLPLGEKAMGWCHELVPVILEFSKGMLAKQAVTNLARVFGHLLPKLSWTSGDVAIVTLQDTNHKAAFLPFSYMVGAHETTVTVLLEGHFHYDSRLVALDIPTPLKWDLGTTRFCRISACDRGPSLHGPKVYPLNLESASEYSSLLSAGPCWPMFALVRVSWLNHRPAEPLSTLIGLIFLHELAEVL